MKLQFPKHYEINKKDEREIRRKAKKFLYFAFWLLIGLITGLIIRYFIF